MGGLQHAKNIDVTNLRHSHNPSKIVNPIGRFLDFFFRMKKVYFHHDNTGVCSVCGTSIMAPQALFSWPMKLAYFIAGAGIMLFMVLLVFPVDSWLLSIVCGLFANLLFNRLATALVLALFPWEVYDTTTFSVDAAWEATKQAWDKNYAAMRNGILISGFLIGLIYFATK